VRLVRRGVRELVLEEAARPDGRRLFLGRLGGAAGDGVGRGFEEIVEAARLARALGGCRGAGGGFRRVFEEVFDTVGLGGLFGCRCGVSGLVGRVEQVVHGLLGGQRAGRGQRKGGQHGGGQWGETKRPYHSGVPAGAGAMLRRPTCRRRR
jgi:hypothetical protein